MDFDESCVNRLGGTEINLTDDIQTLSTKQKRHTKT